MTKKPEHNGISYIKNPDWDDSMVQEIFGDDLVFNIRTRLMLMEQEKQKN